MMPSDIYLSVLSDTLLPEEQGFQSRIALPSSKPLKGRRRLMTDEHREKLTVSQKLAWAERRARQAAGVQPERRPTGKPAVPGRALATTVPQRPVVVAPPSKRTGTDPAKKANTAESATPIWSDLFR